MLNTITRIGVTNLYLVMVLDHHMRHFTTELTLAYHDGGPAQC